ASGLCVDVTGANSASGTPLDLWTCVPDAANQKWALGLASPARVDDGKWHQATLASDGTTQTLYLDGQPVAHDTGPTPATTAQPYLYLGAGNTGTGLAGLPTGQDNHFNGTLAETAFYRNALPAAAVSAQYAASKSSTGLTPVQNVTVTDPGGKS